MADEGNVISDLNLGNAEDNAPAAGIISQYVKDLSVENPSAPDSFTWQESPQIDVQFNIGARQVEGEVHEVELKITCASRTDQGTAFVVDLSYAGLVGMRNLDDQQAHAFLFADAPRILFPFARRVVADAIRDAGFPPFLLEPIDFNGLYVQQLQAQAEQEANGLGEPVGHA